MDCCPSIIALDFPKALSLLESGTASAHSLSISPCSWEGLQRDHNWKLAGAPVRQSNIPQTCRHGRRNAAAHGSPLHPPVLEQGLAVTAADFFFFLRKSCSVSLHIFYRPGLCWSLRSQMPSPSQRLSCPVMSLRRALQQLEFLKQHQRHRGQRSTLRTFKN